jgi:hypothetical protein
VLTFTQFGPHNFQTVPPGVQVVTDSYAVSRTGHPMTTANLSHCLGVVLHDPNARVGCLAHVSPTNYDSQAKLLTLFDELFRLLGKTRTTSGTLEVAFFGSNGTTGSFDTDFTAVVGTLGLQMTRVHDGRSCQSQRGTTLGTAVPNCPNYTGVVCYDPGNEAVWFSGLATSPYTGTTTATPGVNGCQRLNSTQLTGGGLRDCCLII